MNMQKIDIFIKLSYLVHKHRLSLHLLKFSLISINKVLCFSFCFVLFCVFHCEILNEAGEALTWRQEALCRTLDPMFSVVNKSEFPFHRFIIKILISWSHNCRQCFDSHSFLVLSNTSISIRH